MEEFNHRMPVQLRFSDFDQFGHVNNSVYFSLYDMCKTEYFATVLGGDLFKRVGVVVANINANFLSPIYYNEQIVIETKTTHLGHKSFNLMQRAINAETQEVKCECTTVMVVFDIKEKHPVEIPEDFRQKVVSYEQNTDL